MIKKLFIIIVIICILVFTLNYFGQIDLNTILPEDITSILPIQEETTKEPTEKPTEKPTEETIDTSDITDEDTKAIEDELSAIEKALKTRDEINSAMEKWFLENLDTIITVALVAFEAFGMIGDIKDLKKAMKELNPDGLKSVGKKFKKMKKSMKSKSLKKLTNIKGKFKKIKLKKLTNVKGMATDTRRLVSGITDKINKKNIKMFNKTVDGLKEMGSIGDVKKIANLRDAAKTVKQINNGLNAVSDTAATAKTIKKGASAVADVADIATDAKKVMKVGKSIPFAGLAFALGGAALCFASANATEGPLANDYKDDPDAVVGANIACGIELAIDLITEAMDYLAIGSLAFLGPVGLAIAVILAVISIVGLILDSIDPCGYDRPMEKDETLEEFRKSVLSNFFTTIIDSIAQEKQNIVDGIKDALKSQLNEVGFNFTDDDMTKLVSDGKFQKEKLGQSFEEIFGVTFDQLVDEQIATIIEDMKYTKPYEFSGMDASLFKDSDLEKYNSYLNEYYDKCNLIPDPLSLEQRRAYSESRKLKSKQRLFIATLQLENARKLDEISQVQLDQATQLEQTAAALLNILKDVKNATDAYKEGNRKKLNLIKEKVNNYEVMKEMIDEVTSNEIINLVEKQSEILLENPDYDVSIILEPLDLTQKEKDEIIQNIKDVTEYKREFRKEVQKEIEFFIELNNAVKKAKESTNK